MAAIVSILIFLSALLLGLSFSIAPKPRILPALDLDIDRQKKRPLLFRIFKFIMPLNKIINSKLGQEKVGYRLMALNIPILPEEFLFLKEIFLALLVWVSFMSNPKIDIIWIVGAIIISMVLPDIWLKLRVNSRNNKIIKVLPDVIDLLCLCVNVGLDFGHAVKWVVDKSKPNPMIDELRLFLMEVNIGKSRRQAFQDMAKRINLPEVDSFTRALIQAERLGTPIEAALDILSEDIREFRFRRGEKLALQAPIKMLFPLIFFIMPVVLIIVGGPILLQFMQGGGLTAIKTIK